jgi:hypothetical protein
MQRIKLMIRAFLSEPLWFKILISITFLASIFLSNSIFSDHAYLQASSKLASFKSWKLKGILQLKEELIS